MPKEVILQNDPLFTEVSLEEEEQVAVEESFPEVEDRRVVLERYDLRTLQEIINSDFPKQTPLVKRFLTPGETALLIARQKEGKSTLALQLAIDVSCGEAFLNHYRTERVSVLYVDYENRPHRLKQRGIDLAGGRTVDDLILVAYESISDRNVGLFGKEFDRLHSIVTDLHPGLLILDPLRYAAFKDSTDEQVALKIIDRVAQLRDGNPEMAVILVHHLKKDQGNLTAQLRDDPRAWIERVYGSQVLLAHTENIWGLEHDETGYVFGTVPRSEESFVVMLEKVPDSQRFTLSATPVQVAGMPGALQQAWQRLPQEFSRSEGINLGIPNNTLDRLIRRARATGLLTQDPKTKRYRKVGEAQNVGEVVER